MQYRKLGKTNLDVSILGFGASSLGSVFRPISEDEGIQAVHTALDLGLNLIDVSPYYGLTKAEIVLGKALKGIARDRYILATKVGRYGEAEFDFSAQRVTASVDESLARLGVDYVDLIQCHDIEFGSLDQIVNETIPALRRLQTSGKVRFVGVSGLPLHIFRVVLAQTDVDSILSYCRYTLNDRSLIELLPYLKEKGVGILSAAPLGMGLLTRQGPPSWHPATLPIKEVCAQAAQYCAERGVEIAQLALQFSLAQPAIASTLVGTAAPEEVRQNVRWLETPLDLQLLADVQTILAPIRNQVWPMGRPENNDPLPKP
jgi:L-galactose dehydrogenase